MSKTEGGGGSLKNWHCPEEDNFLGGKLNEEENLSEEEEDYACTK